MKESIPELIGKSNGSIDLKVSQEDGPSDKLWQLQVLKVVEQREAAILTRPKCYNSESA